MAGFSVDDDELRRASDAVRSIHAELANADGLRFEMAQDEVGHDELAVAVANFQQSSRYATTCLLADVGATADRLALNAAEYRRTEQAIAEGFGHTTAR